MMGIGPQEILVLVILGLIPAAIARSKGGSFLLWWFYGTVLLPLAFLHALFRRTDRAVTEAEYLKAGTWKRCAFCAEAIREAATVCRYCGRDVAAPPSEPLTGWQRRRDAHKEHEKF